MTRDQAIKRLSTLYGRKAYYRVGTSITSPDKREAARLEVTRLRAEEEAAKAAIASWLAAQPDYQALVAHKRAITKAREAAGWALTDHKFNVGINRGWCVEMTGSGDTWEEAIAAAERGGARS